jgi:hypothetical protein
VKRFGFARFEDVEDRQQLLNKIEDMWIGTYKLRANLPKFSRQGGVNKQIPNNKVNTTNVNRFDSNVQPNGKSFKDIVQGGNNGSKFIQKGWMAKGKSKGRAQLTDEEYRAGIMSIDAEPQIVKKLEGSFVGTLTEINDVDSIQTTMWMEVSSR